MKLCFATNNKGKLLEIQTALAGHYDIVSLQDIGCNEELPETQKTIEGNSLQKAAYVWDNYQVSCFADDTGLEINALNGEPGVYSARYAGPACSPDDNMDFVLEKLKGTSNRMAKFRTCITLILNGKTHQFEGIALGEILLERQGGKGFGYDPIFQPEGFTKSFAEMSIEEKNTISHRGQAIQKLLVFLRK